MRYVILSALLCFAVEAGHPLRSSVRLTRLQCYSNSLSRISYEQCEVKHSDNVYKVLAFCNVKEILNKIQVKLKCFRKQPIGYVPYAVDFTIDWCDFMEKRNNEIMNRLFNTFQQYSNLNQKCPFTTEYAFVNFTLNRDGTIHLPFKFPEGEYRLDVKIDVNKDIIVVTNIFFQIE